METDVITIREVTVYLNMAEKNLYRLAAKGNVPVFKVGGASRFHWRAISKWIKEREQIATRRQEDE